MEIIGWAGAISLLYAFFLIQTKRVEHNNKWYLILNIIGSLFLAINTYYHTAYPSVVTNVIWFIISAYSIYLLMCGDIVDFEL